MNRKKLAYYYKSKIFPKSKRRQVQSQRIYISPSQKVSLLINTFNKIESTDSYLQNIRKDKHNIEINVLVPTKKTFEIISNTRIMKRCFILIGETQYCSNNTYPFRHKVLKDIYSTLMRQYYRTFFQYPTIKTYLETIECYDDTSIIKALNVNVIDTEISTFKSSCIDSLLDFSINNTSMFENLYLYKNSILDICQSMIFYKNDDISILIRLYSPNLKQLSNYFWKTLQKQCFVALLSDLTASQRELYINVSSALTGLVVYFWFIGNDKGQAFTMIEIILLREFLFFDTEEFTMYWAGKDYINCLSEVLRSELKFKSELMVIQSDDK
jgi:hypothetical protein